MKQWAFKKIIRTVQTPAMYQRIITLFYDIGLEDDEMLHVLKSDGYEISMRGLKQLRIELNIIRRYPRHMVDENNQKIREWMEREMQTGNIETFGRGLL